MNVSVLILAGGKSSRMNGNNKAFLAYKNKSFIENIIDSLEDIKDIYISVDDIHKYKSLNYPLIEDEYKDIGPIGGMYSSFKMIKSDFIIVLACDMPMVNKEFISFLINNIRKDDSCIVFKDSENRLYPLGAVYNRNILKELEISINNRDYKLMNLIKKVNGRIIEFNDNEDIKKSLINVNDLNEYEKLNKYSSEQKYLRV